MKKLILGLLLLLLTTDLFAQSSVRRRPIFPAGGGAEHTDNFNRADSTTLGALSGGIGTWAEPEGDLTISGNLVIVAGVGTNSYARVDTGLSSANHYAQCTVTVFTAAPTAFNNAGVILRYASAAQTFYHIRVMYNNDAGTEVIMEIREFSAGTPTTLASQVTTFVSGDIIKASIDSGHTIRAYKNGSEVVSHTDASPITGNTQWGIAAFVRSSGSASDIQIDNCEAGT